MLGFDLQPLDGAPGSQAPADVQRAVNERVAMLRTLPTEVKEERERRLAEYVRLKGDRRARREASKGIPANKPNTRILDDTPIEVLK